MEKSIFCKANYRSCHREMTISIHLNWTTRPHEYSVDSNIHYIFVLVYRIADSFQAIKKQQFKVKTCS